MSRIHDLLQQMTLQEKVGQLLQLTPSFLEEGVKEANTGPMAELGLSETQVWQVGSILGASSAEQIRQLQMRYLERSRLKIPLLFMADVIHGYRTIFPVPLAMGCTWDPKQVEMAAAIAAKEATASGLHVTFSPMVDLVRDPRWGRVVESCGGEDAFLNGVFGKAFVRGYQGDDLTDQEKMAACVKHFAAYGAPEGGRDYNTVDMSELKLRSYYLPAYQEVIDSGARLVMTSFNTVDGVPATGNAWLLQNILRKEWGFQGVVISDWGAVKELIPHGVAADLSEAARLAIRAGVDIEMMSAAYPHHLEEIIADKGIPIEHIDEAVLRILRLKEELGLFDDPYRGVSEQREQAVLLHPHHREAAKQLALDACVLLKNEGVLPLSANQKVAVVGPFATSQDVLGPWSAEGRTEEAVPLLQGIEDITGQKVAFALGTQIQSPASDEAQALRIAAEADVIIAAFGEASWMSGEAGCLTDIRLPKAQRQFFHRLRQLGKPIVTVLFNGRPLDIRDMVAGSQAVLEAWYPGSETGTAIAELLYGKKSPSGRLTMSFPYSVGQVPVHYDHYRTGRPVDAPDAQERYVSQYLDAPNEPLFPFGFGLTYSEVRYSKVTASSREMTADEGITFALEIENRGCYEVIETVQWYIRDCVAEVVRPVKQLKGFERIPLGPGEAKQATFTVKEPMLRYLHRDGSVRSDPGTYVVYVGANSRDVQGISFQLRIASMQEGVLP